MNWPIPFSFLLALSLPFASAAAEFKEAIATLNAVGPEGKGNVEAAAAWKSLTTEADSTVLLPLLESMENASPLARNWLRSAVDVIVEREQAAGNSLPVATLGEFLLDTRQSPQARRLTFDLIAKLTPETAEEMIPGFLGDPSTSLRRDAVQRLMNQAAATKDATAALLLRQQAIAAARDVDQIEKLAEALEDAGHPVDLPEHFGFLMYWKLAAPFDNTDRSGFETVYPPEEALDLETTYTGKEGQAFAWTDYKTTDTFGMVDFNPIYEPLKQVVGYATTDFHAPAPGPAEIRLGCKNAWKVWLNGEYLFGRDEYHRGTKIDQYTIPVQLKAGKNTILIKVCQNEQEQDWTVQWQFQMRICDSTGTAILGTERLPTPVKAAVDRRGRPITTEDAP